MKIIGTDSKMFKINDSCKKVIKPGGNCQFTATFKPTSARSETATLQIISKDKNTATIEILLSGMGL